MKVFLFLLTVNWRKMSYFCFIIKLDKPFLVVTISDYKNKNFRMTPNILTVIAVKELPNLN